MTRTHTEREGYQGISLTFSHNYRACPQNRELEADFVQILSYLIMDDGNLSLFYERLCAIADQFRKEGQLDSHLGTAIHNCLFFFRPVCGYTEEEIYGRLLDVWNWIAYSHNIAIVQEVEARLIENEPTQKVQIVQDLPMIEQKSGLLLLDVLKRLEQVCTQEMPLLDFFAWLNHPLMLWEIILTGRQLDPRLYELLEKIQHYWYISRYEMYDEHDVLDQFRRILASYDVETVLSLLKNPTTPTTPHLKE